MVWFPPDKQIRNSVRFNNTILAIQAHYIANLVAPGYRASTCTNGTLVEVSFLMNAEGTTV